ncbi:MAG: thymidine kinase [[Pasteurella] mairii]|uniref:Thymidine kinase n=1 Tax=[Pasteurella] mairii TaxID=757 RepID=A0A379B6N1_9PAST|nr:thymidine kinase [[Pasteurella] mairii]SUB34247.1 thymidine kinase [[Pasteurella] mairii]
MAKLYFYYSTMNAGKSTTLLQSDYNYRERDMNTLVYTAAIDDRFGQGQVTSRIGIHQDANLFHKNTDLFLEIATHLEQQKLHCILVDEAQFLTKEQVYQLSDVVDKLHIPVLCYGLRTDFQAELFEGSQYLLAWADQLEELKTICYCGRKANFVLRLNAQGEVVKDGEQIQIGGNERYLSVCRQHYKEKIETSKKLSAG